MNPIYKANVICSDLNNEQLACGKVNYSLDYFSTEFGQQVHFQIDQNTVNECSFVKDLFIWFLIPFSKGRCLFVQTERCDVKDSIEIFAHTGSLN
jgi:hypothetical protein